MLTKIMIVLSLSSVSALSFDIHDEFYKLKNSEQFDEFFEECVFKGTSLKHPQLLHDFVGSMDIDKLLSMPEQIQLKFFELPLQMRTLKNNL